MSDFTPIFVLLGKKYPMMINYFGINLGRVGRNDGPLDLATSENRGEISIKKDGH